MYRIQVILLLDALIVDKGIHGTMTFKENSVVRRTVPFKKSGTNQITLVKFVLFLDQVARVVYQTL